MRDRVKRLVKRVPGTVAIVRLLRAPRIRHKLLTTFGDRQNYVYTRFMRSQTQFDLLAGPVVDLLSIGSCGLDVVVIGCSTGAEPYSIASVLLDRRPGLEFSVRAFDIDHDVLARAREGTYTHEEVHLNPAIDPEFVARTFDIRGDHYRVKPSIAERVAFDIADALDPTLHRAVGTADVVYAQNFLYHLRPAESRRAFDHVCRLLRRRSALFIDGMDLDLRESLTRKHRLVPVQMHLEDIHRELWNERGWAWPRLYWGLEPFERRRGWERRYATAFLQGCSGI